MVATADAAVPAPPALDSGATAWVLTASALVLFMTLSGLTLFYGGLVRTANLPAVLMRRTFVITCVVSLVWLAIGYSLVFSPGNGLIGSLRAAFLNGVSKQFTPTGVPEGAFALFQMTFAIITPALIIGAITERARFSFVILFSAIWTAVVYVPVAHWVWGSGGWLAGICTIDFAGGIVVHTTAGVSALVAAWLIGPRDGFPQRISPPQNPAMTTVGAAMLWVGWFGFNGGSALAANASAASAILATQFAAAAAGLAWVTVERLRLGKRTSIGIASGCIAGEIASVGDRRVSFDLLDFYHNESRPFGVDTRHRDAVASGALLEVLTPVFEQGAFKAPKIDRVIPLSEGGAAYEQVARGEARGRLVLAP
jgi:Amt family ammonium transporter